MRPWQSFLLLLLIGSAAGAAPRTYAIDSSASTATARVGKTGLASFAGHEHLVTAGDLQGEVVFDAEDLPRSSVDLVIPARALRVSPEGEPEGDAPKVEQAMRGPGVLDILRFATLHVRSVEVKGARTAPGTWALTLAIELTLHGVTKSFSVPLQLEVRGDLLTATGKLAVKQTEFGIEPTTAAGGLVKVEDEVGLAFRIVARAAAP